MKDSLIEFWEILTGVIDDNKSKMIKLSCFGILFFGMLWAALNYFRATRITDTTIDFEDEMPEMFSSNRDESQAIEKIENIAKTVGIIRDGGEAIANKITELHTKPFNIEGLNEVGLEKLTANGESTNLNLQALNETQAQQQEAIPVVNVRAVILSNTGNKAVIDAGGRFGVIVKRGSKLPDNLGRVTKIQADGITVRTETQDIKYDVSRGYSEVEGVKMN